MKRIIGPLMTCILFFSLVVSIQADSLSAPQVSERDTETTVISQATEDENFEAGVVLVTLKKKSTVINKKHPPSAFKGVRVDSVTDLSCIENEEAMNWIDKDNYHQILKLELKDKSKSAVLDAIKKLEKRNDVLRATPNYIFTLDEGLPEEDSAELEEIPSDESGEEETIPSATSSDPNTTQYVLNKMQLPQAWNLTTGSPTVTVGVLDSGIDPNHEDLKANLNTSLGQNYTDDGLAAWTDPVGHGTHVAGIIGAVGNNGKGIAGVCWNVKLVSLRVFKRTYDENGNIKGTGKMDWVVDAVKYAINHQIPIINYSGSGNSQNKTLRDAISNYPGLLVCSAGNGKDHDNNDKTPNIPVDMDTDSLKFYPACYPNDNIISVANTTSSDQLASTSNYGATTVDLGAPGSNIYSTIPGGSYDYKSGTSMASPQVAGVAALIQAFNPNMDALQIKQVILNSVDPVSALSGKCVSGGRLNAYKALQKTQSYPADIKNLTVSGDFNGDQKSDLAYFVAAPNEAMQIQVRLSNGSTYSDTQNWCYNTQYNSLERIRGRVAVGEFNGDGKDDIAAMYEYNNNTMKIHVWLSTGSSFNGFYSWLDSMTPGSYEPARVTGRFVAGDFNGDGKDDLAAMYKYNDDTMKLQVWPSTGSSFNGFYSWKESMTPGSYNADRVTGRFVAGDFNGDGKDDLAAMYKYNDDTMKLQVWPSTGSSFNGFYSWKESMTPGSYNADRVTGRFVAGDFNGDGKDDLAAMYKYNGDTMKIQVWPSTGSSFNGFYSWKESMTPGSYEPDRATGLVVCGDMNADGKDDITALYAYNEGLGQPHIYKSTGTSF